MRRVAVVTGTRAEYGILRSVMEAIAEHPKLTLQTVVTGMHLLRKFGHTVRQIERDGWRIDARVRMQRGDDDPLDQAIGLARGVAGIAAYLERAKTDIVLVLGDRIEAMAGALAATTTGRFVAHVHGGDVAPGDLDGVLRDGVTKLAHIHLVASKEAARRVMRLGEAAESVHVVGAPGLDRLMLMSRDSCTGTKWPEAIVVQHAHGRSASVEKRVMRTVLRAVRAHDLNTVVVYPNSDRGHTGIIEAIESSVGSANGSRRLRAVRSVERDEYLRMLVGARVLVGNSSSGIIEAPAAGTASVNIGTRQRGRLRSGQSVIETSESYDEVFEAIGRALGQRPRKSRRGAYGDGGSGVRIAGVLARTRWCETLRQKRVT